MEKTESVTVDDLNVARAFDAPDEANSPLLVNTNAVLTLPVALQSLKVVAWRRFQKFNRCSSRQLRQLSFSKALKTAEPFRLSGFEQRLRICIFAYLNDWVVRLDAIPFTGSR